MILQGCVGAQKFVFLVAGLAGPARQANCTKLTGVGQRVGGWIMLCCAILETFWVPAATCSSVLASFSTDTARQAAVSDSVSLLLAPVTGDVL